MKAFFESLEFLTVIPIPSSLRGGEGGLGRLAPWFPLTGLFIGLMAVALNYGATSFLPLLPSVAITVLFLSWISGGLHMDGLSDTADGFLSGAGRERIVEIMKDSRAGAMGVFAVASVVLLKTCALASVAPAHGAVAVLLTPVAGRCAMLYAVATQPYVSGPGGLGHALNAGYGKSRALWAVAALAVAGLAGVGLWGLSWAVTVLVVVLLFARWCAKKIGGMTGDNYGALCEISETVSLLFFSAMV
ncbi:MAG: adenosylcobinamide-GDP ribazoletransferase [Nitrospinae bacterium]|nr:adenosylcobinamide-GDP ribazoletransferase [Nitrospinota bacterium]